MTMECLVMSINFVFRVIFNRLVIDFCIVKIEFHYVFERDSIEHLPMNWKIVEKIRNWNKIFFLLIVNSPILDKVQYPNRNYPDQERQACLFRKNQWISFNIHPNLSLFFYFFISMSCHIHCCYCTYFFLLLISKTQMKLEIFFFQLIIDFRKSCENKWSKKIMQVGIFFSPVPLHWYITSDILPLVYITTLFALRSSSCTI